MPPITSRADVRTVHLTVSKVSVCSRRLLDKTHGRLLVHLTKTLQTSTHNGPRRTPPAPRHHRVDPALPRRVHDVHTQASKPPSTFKHDPRPRSCASPGQAPPPPDRCRRRHKDPPCAISVFFFAPSRRVCGVSGALALDSFSNISNLRWPGCASRWVTSWVSVGASLPVFLPNRVGYGSECCRGACGALFKHTDRAFLHFGDGPVLPVITIHRRISPAAFSHKRVARHGHAHSAIDASDGRLQVPMVRVTSI